MDDYDRVQLQKEHLVICVCSTTGQGTEPVTMQKFWKFLLRKSHSPTLLSHIQFGVFGLGDSSYLRFNFPAKKLHKRLLQLGAQALVPRGDGDDQHYLGLDGALDPWLDNLWGTILEKWPIPEGKEIIGDDILPQASFDIQFVSDETPPSQANGETPESTTGHSHIATVLTNRRITAPDHFQDVRHMEFNIESASYEVGDVMSIRPHNLATEVQQVIEHFEWQHLADKPFRLIQQHEDIRPPPQYPPTLTLRQILTDHLDIFGRPRRYFFELLAFFATDPLHAEKLREFGSAAGQDELYSYCHRPRRTMFEVLQDFHSAKVPLKYLFDLIPEMRPRSFSIASSPKAHSGRIHLAVAIVEYKTKMKTPRRGVCTKWMRTLEAGDKVRFNIKKGTMVLPKDASLPLVMVGPGTGVAPMRAFIQDRIANKATDNMLFFGCRNQDKDFLFKEEFEQHEANNELQLVTAFSRDQDHKIYVQHRIKDHAPDIYRKLCLENGVILLSGNANRMPTDVADALAQCMVDIGKMSREDAEKHLKEMTRTGRFQEECWS
ncbi:NADPH-dependent diflavin oxidoreductase 1 [Gaertneriomyces sp. JEL0708]|nr:NADPH-dependent diflavin oxidoreductase 1 [Gaertneriomyces sp. JEL0708]